MSSAAGTGSNNPFAGNDVLPVHSIHDNQPDAVFHFVDEYVESVCIEEYQGADDGTWSDDLACNQSPVYEDSESTRSPVAEITPAELESFNELIRFDHMYFRQPSNDSDVCLVEEPLDQSETFESIEVTSELVCKEETTGLESEEDLNLSSFSESDLAQLTDCLDWLIDSSADELTENKAVVSEECERDTSCLGLLDDIESSCLTEHSDSLTSFTDDSFISTTNFDCSIDQQNSYNSTFSPNFENTSLENLLQNNGLHSRHEYNEKPKDIVGNKSFNESDSKSFVDSVINCSSPCSSSGCESDFSSSSYEDEHFSFSTDIGLMDLSDEPFNELFPALY